MNYNPKFLHVKCFCYVLVCLLQATSYAQNGDYVSGKVLDLPMNGNLNNNNGFTFSNNSAVLTPDRFGNPNRAYRLNGSSAFISAPGFTVPTTNLTISFWINMLGTNTEGLSMFICAANTYFYIALRNSDGTVNSYKSPTTSPFATDSKGFITSSQIVNQNWKHIVVAFTGNTASYYLNGNPTTPVNTSTSNIGVLDNTANNFVIGAYNASTSANHFYFNGDVDEIKVYNRTLNSADV